MRNLLLLFCVLAFALQPSRALAQPVETDHVIAELVSEVTSIQPGVPFWVALRMEMEENWHTYWLNPGDSGMPTNIFWELPDGFFAGEIHWPYPEWIRMGPVVSYGYHGEIFLLVELTPPDDLEPGTEVRLAAESDWLVCEEICLPGDAYVTLTLPVTNDSPQIDDRWAHGFEQTREREPVIQPDEWDVSAEAFDDYLYLTVTFPGNAPRHLANAQFFATTSPVVNHSAEQHFTVRGNTLQIRLERSSYASGDIERLAGVIVSERGFGDDALRNAVLVEAPVEVVDSAPVLATGSGVPGGTLGLALLFALIGGLLLNLMPCVFPVLSLKILNFVQISGDDAAKVRNHGMLFAAGVLLSFLILAGLLIGLRAGGQELGWGFQLQSPVFIVGITFLLFAFALNLLGVFEIGLSFTGFAGKFAHSTSYAGSFSAGVLATILATPCTAPFMGTALGVALALPAVHALLIFLALGFGMALPYVVFSFFPRLLRILPRPGAWMETFKQAMAFPLFATVIWLVWVFGQQVGVDGVLYLLVGLMCLSIAAWILGRWNGNLVSVRARFASRAVATAALALGVYFSLSGAFLAPAVASGDGVQTDRFGIEWEPYSTERVQQWRAEGETVFIDFTAAWCLTCKVNEQVVFSSREVRQRVNELGIRMVKADWTSRNPEITRALQSYGRSGVPLYVLYHDGAETPPIILPEVLNTSIFLNALERTVSSAPEDLLTRK